MISIIDVIKRFGNEQVLSNINMEIQTGDIFGIIGLSGAGKSTLIKIMGLLETPTMGQVLVDNQDLQSLSKIQKLNYLRSIGTIFQGYNLLMQKTVFENVAFPLRLAKVSEDEIKKRVNKLLNLVGLSEKADMYPSKLSGGQKQRVAISRALVNNPKILLCDEPTSALDSITTTSILKLLKKINKEYKVTIVIITHDINVVKSICDNVAVIDKGHVVDMGNVSFVEENCQSIMSKQFFGKEGEENV